MVWYGSGGVRVISDALFLGCMVAAVLLAVIAAALWLAKKLGYLEETR